jgi:hypothetical protein
MMVMGGVFLALLMLEVFVRLSPFGEGVRQLQHNLTFESSYYGPDEEAGYDIRPNRPHTKYHFSDGCFEIWSNRYGCFDEDFDPTDPHPFVLLLGDSFVHSFSAYGNKYGSLLEQLLQERIVKAGVSGYGPKQEYLKARKLIHALNRYPSLTVVAYYIGNDALEDYLFPTRVYAEGCLRRTKSVDASGRIWNIEPPHGLAVHARDFLKRHSALCWAASEGMKRVFPTTILQSMMRERLVNCVEPFRGQHYPGPIFMEDWFYTQGVLEKSLNELLTIRELVSAKGGDFLVVLVPSKEQVYPYLLDEAYRNLDLERPNRFILRFLAEKQVDCLDLLPGFRQRANPTPRHELNSSDDLYWKIDGHWNAKGNRLAAELTAAHIKRQREHAQGTRGKREETSLTTHDVVATRGR